MFIERSFVFKRKNKYDIYVLRPLELDEEGGIVWFTYYLVSKKRRMKHYEKGSDYKVVYEYDCVQRQWYFTKIMEIGY